MYPLIPILTVAAYLTSTVSGVVGMAGGAMLLGVMVVAGIEPAVAVPVHAVVQLTSNTTRAWAFLPNIRWRPFLYLAIAAAPGPVLGLWLLQHLDAGVVKLLMGVTILYATWAPRGSLGRLSEKTAFVLAGMVAGTLGVIVGATGPFLAPFFLRGGFLKEQIIGTKAACQMYIHVLKIVAFTAVGFSFRTHAGLAVPMALATVAGTFTGKWLLGKLSEGRFRLLYRSVLTVLALRLLAAVYLP